MNFPSHFLDTAEEQLYLEWKRYGHHLEEYASEFAGTVFLVFCIVLVVGVMFGAHSPIPHLIQSKPVRLFCAGILIGGSGWLVALSPPGRLSGGHINPAVSIGFWIMGKMHGRDLIGYIIAQMSGGILGVVLANHIIPELAHDSHDAFLSPVHGMSPPLAFLCEAMATFLLASIIFVFVSSQKLMRWTPAMVTLTAGVLVCLDGSLSGAGINPARWFGPAWVAHNWSLAWVYAGGPITGGAGAAFIRCWRALFANLPHTAKIYHDDRYRSVFLQETAPSKPPASAFKTYER